jgi:S-adenosylmethionine:tRNA ribosyltransferase-isomerase
VSAAVVWTDGTPARLRRDFQVPAAQQASGPPERRGVARDEVRLLVAEPGRLRHRRFRDLPSLLEPGDLVVVNTSATVPAALDGWRVDGSPVTLHVAGPSPSGRVLVELRRDGGAGRVRDTVVGEEVDLQAGPRLRLVAPSPSAPGRLWEAELGWDGPLEDLLLTHGRPVAYGHLDGPVPLSDLQPVVARHPGSAEMASAGRPLTETLIVDLVTAGIVVAPITLHAGVSSLEAGEDPPPERFTVPEVTARLVDHTHRGGGRVVAVGTTVVRALESVASIGGTMRAGAGWTDLVLGPQRPARVVDGLVTGWHEADASHLSLLDAVAGVELVDAAYDAALAGSYLWHEFGDSCLFLP